MKIKNQEQRDEAMRRAWAMHNGGRMFGAENIYRDILQFDHNDRDANYLLGLIEASRGDNEKAERLIRKAIATDDSVADFHHHLGRVLEETGRFAEAMEEQQAAIERNPFLAQAYMSMSDIMAGAGRLDEAIAVLKKGAERCPTVPELGANIFAIEARKAQLAKEAEAAAKSDSVQ